MPRSPSPVQIVEDIANAAGLKTLGGHDCQRDISPSVSPRGPMGFGKHPRGSTGGHGKLSERGVPTRYLFVCRAEGIDRCYILGAICMFVFFLLGAVSLKSFFCSFPDLISFFVLPLAIITGARCLVTCDR